MVATVKRLLISSLATLVLMSGWSLAPWVIATAGNATAGNATAGNATAGDTPAGGWADPAFAEALQLLHAGRLADAYGRIVALANAGHADAARLATTMCRHGLRLYASDWDCSPAELDEWAHFASQPAPGPLGSSPRRQ